MAGFSHVTAGKPVITLNWKAMSAVKE